MSKDEILSLLDKFHTLESSVRALEQNTRQEIQTLQKAIVKRIGKNEEFIEIGEQGQKVQGQDLASSVYARPRSDLHRVSTTYPVIALERSSGTKCTKVVKEYA